MAENTPEAVESDLLELGRIAWPPEPCDWEAARQALRPLLPLRLQALLDLHLALLGLADTSQRERLRWVRERLPVASLFAGLGWDACAQGRWVLVPVPVAKGGRGRLIQFLVGALPPETTPAPWPAWVETALAPESRHAVDDAFFAARQGAPPTQAHLAAIPLLPPSGGRALRDRSLGLPIALGARSVLSGEPLSNLVIATGELSRDGRVGAVAGSTLGAKARKAAAHGAALFLCPAGNQPAKKSEGGVDWVPARDLSQAWLWARLYEPDCAGDLERLEVALQSAGGFVDNCGRLRPDLVEWCRREGTLDEVLACVRKDRRLLQQLTQQLERILADDGWNPAAAQALGGLLCEDGHLDEAAVTSPLGAFSWCSLNLAHANHCGRNDRSEHWAGCAARYAGAARRADPAAFCTFVNRRVVFSLHNRYRFKPDLPDDFLQVLKDQERSRQALGGVDLELGSLYGTQAQNYAFCGPAYLRQFEECVARAQEAFGGGEVTDLLYHWRRGFSYLCAAWLDAGDPQRARKALWNYLGAASWEEIEARFPLEDFEGYYVARYLADGWNPQREPELERAAEAMLRQLESGVLPARHPWELWASALGRAAAKLGKHEAAREAWRKSIGLCREIGGEAVRAMALVPAGCLATLGELKGDDRALVEEVFEWLKSSRALCREHFSEILDARDGVDAATRVAERASRYFPFTYR